MYTTTVTRYEEKKEADRTLENDVEPLPVPRERTPASQPIIWRNVIGIIVLHFLAVYGFVSGYRDAKFWTWIWSEYTSWLRQLPLSPTFPNFLRLAATFILTRSEFQSNRLLTYQIFELAGKSIFILFSLPTSSFLSNLAGSRFNPSPFLDTTSLRETLFTFALRRVRASP